LTAVQVRAGIVASMSGVEDDNETRGGGWRNLLRSAGKRQGECGD
jgi:hypothetical protein